MDDKTNFNIYFRYPETELSRDKSDIEYKFNLCGRDNLLLALFDEVQARNKRDLIDEAKKLFPDDDWLVRFGWEKAMQYKGLDALTPDFPISERLLKDSISILTDYKRDKAKKRLLEYIEKYQLMDTIWELVGYEEFKRGEGKNH